ncbi:MAG: glucan ABC transporter ATP-binding protein/ permease [Alphaproteobacteria bacterium]|nr:glucan ABC transporter ATP-binding protein/ permease [Alphaproteobacteria bacterium]
MEFVRIYKRVLRLLVPERRLTITLSVANVMLAGLHFLEPVLFGKVIDVLTQSDKRSEAETWSDAVKLLAIWGVVGIGGISASILISLHADRLAHRRRLAALGSYFEHVLSLPLSFHGETHSGRLLKVMLNGVDHLFGLWLSFFREHLETFVIAVVLLPLSLFLNWRLGILLIALLVIFAFLASTVISRTEQAQRSIEGYHSQLAERAGDALGNVMLVQSFVRLQAEAQQLGEVMRQVLSAQFPVLTMWAIVTVLTRAASTITVIAIFVLGTWLHMHGLASVGEIVTFMGFATQVIGRMEQAMGFLSRLFFQMPGLAEFFGVLDAESTIKERPGAVPLENVKGDVSFEHVTFSYDGKCVAVHDLDFVAPTGTVIAFVGHTGSGKSTSMALLHRVWDPDQGAIKIDGTDIRDVTLESLRRNIGVVFQDSTMFYRTIADNLRVAKPDASDAKLERAAILAEAHDFILRQPEGYNTMVGERGVTLSGGERQRLAIARAILKDPPILILDEATSALDAATEARVQQALKTLMRGRTTFVIAHRLSTVRNADLILVLERGEIVERGSYQELIARQGIFARLVATQLEITNDLDGERPAVLPPG